MSVSLSVVSAIFSVVQPSEKWFPLLSAAFKNSHLDNYAQITDSWQ